MSENKRKVGRRDDLWLKCFEITWNDMERRVAESFDFLVRVQAIANVFSWDFAKFLEEEAKHFGVESKDKDANKG